MLRRIDLLAGLGTQNITLSGGEPLLHPDVVEIIRRIRSRGVMAGIITNGYLLTPDRIQELNRAGLDQLQISIDNVVPDDVSKKSLKVLVRKLMWLSEFAEFDVNINSVLGGGIQSPQDSFIISKRALALGLRSTIGIIHDDKGQLQALTPDQQRTYQEVKQSGRSRAFDFEHYNAFQHNLVRGLPNDWKCRAGSRYLYICEDGLVHYCSQQRGYPAIPLEEYTQVHLNREYRTIKPCAPYCTISCVHRVSVIDEFRDDPAKALKRFFPKRMPAAVRMLAWMFLPQPKSTARRAAGRLLLRVLGMRK
jgi:MoaA/NifB/PqqE/SkfB family radical SAM enzyme